MSFRALQWDCDANGCFNEKHRLKFGVFYDALPGKISFSDVDGIVEIAGNALMLEWKSTPGQIKGGQAIMYKRITSGKSLTVLCLAGDAEKMSVTHRAIYFDGREPKEWATCGTDDAKEIIRRWSAWAQKNPRIGA